MNFIQDYNRRVIMIDKSAAQEMFKIVNLFKRHLDKQISTNISKDLTVAQGYVISFLNELGESKDIFQKDIEHEFQLHRSSVSSMLSNMEKNGLIQRLTVSEDNRLKKIILTEKALQYEKEIDCIMLEARDYICKNISAEEQQITMDTLEKMRENLIK